MSPSSTGIWVETAGWRESTKCVHVECETFCQVEHGVGDEELCPAKPQSSSKGELGEGVMGLRKRRSTKVLRGLVRTRVDVGSKSVVGRLSGFLSGRWME